MRYKTITKAVNREFWNSISGTTHSLYVGSYGRGTAIDSSDIDILIELLKTEYERYDVYKGNGQSRLLQAVKTAIQVSYPRTDVRADGQVIKVSFTDGMKFEVLPAFLVATGVVILRTNIPIQTWAETGVQRIQGMSKEPCVSKMN